MHVEEVEHIGTAAPKRIIQVLAIFSRKLSNDIFQIGGPTPLEIKFELLRRNY